MPLRNFPAPEKFFPVLLVASMQMVTAAPATFFFSGTVSVTNFAITDPFSGAVVPGIPFSGSLTFESEAADLNPDPNLGSYESPGAPFGFTTTVAGLPFSADGLTVLLGNDMAFPPGSDSLSAASGVSPGPRDTRITMGLFLLGLSGVMLTNANLPLIPPPVPSGPGDDRFFSVRGLDASSRFFEFGGEIERFTVEPAAIPEPSTLALIVIGLSAVTGAFARRSGGRPREG